MERLTESDQMLVIAKDLQAQHERRWIRHRLAANCTPTSAVAALLLNFCSKYGTFAPLEVQFAAFMAKLASKNQPEASARKLSGGHPLLHDGE